MARMLGPKITARDRQRLALGRGKARRVKTASGWLELDTDIALLPILDGLAAAARDILENTRPPDAAPYGEGLVASGGMAGYAFGKVTHVEGAERDVVKPRDFRAPKDGVAVVLGYGFPGRFLETGTVNHGAQPFLTPAVQAGSGRVPAHLRKSWPR